MDVVVIIVIVVVFVLRIGAVGGFLARAIALADVIEVSHQPTLVHFLFTFVDVCQLLRFGKVREGYSMFNVQCIFSSTLP